MKNRHLLLPLASILLLGAAFGAGAARASRLPGAPEAVAQESYDELLRRAEERYAEGSYQLAHELYERAAPLATDDGAKRWVAFRLADTLWRSKAQSDDPDGSLIERARSQLVQLLERYERPEDRDELFAYVHESLGDLGWRPEQLDWSAPQEHYAKALEWWARSSRIEAARARYLAIVWKVALPEWRDRYWGRGYFPTVLPLDVFANAVEIAVTEADRARAHFLLARAWAGQGHDRRAAERIERELGAVLELGKRSEWYDDALYALGTFHEQQGRWERAEDGSMRPRPDFARALDAYRRLVGEFRKGETSYYDDVQQRIRNITTPDLGLEVDRYFLPGSEVPYVLSWRNLENVELELVPIDLVEDVTFPAEDREAWLDRLALRAAPVARWSHDARGGRPHEPARKQLFLSEAPGAGAYVLRARGAGREARALVLVSDAAVTVKVSGTRLLAWVTDVKAGAPIAAADVKAWQRWHDGSWHALDASARSGADGIALFDVPSRGRGGEYLVVARSGARQAFAQGWTPGRDDPAREWRVYAVTDRPAYRPGDPVHWKLWARTRLAGAYATPAGEELRWEVRDPQGTQVQEGASTLNDFGAAWGTLETTAKMTLGEYRVRFFRGERKDYVGDAPLFRLEEYELPEFEVTVTTPRDAEGRPELFRLGDRVEVEVQATYYHGASVAGASVEVFVHQRPRWIPIPLWKERSYPWFYEDTRMRSWWGGPGQQILHDTRTTGPDGKARVAFETPLDVQGDLEFTIEARVVDASRREIVGTGSVVVSEKGYRVDLELAHAIHRPGSKVQVTVHAADANGNGVSDDGAIVVTRKRWIEVWRDASGKDVMGAALERATSDPAFPPPGWTPRTRGYESEVVAQLEVRTDAKGEATFEFTPAEAGHYEVAWNSTDDRGAEIRAETTVFVADESTRQLGYLPGGIELLVDRDTLAVGEDATVLLLAPQSGRWVLFTVENEDLVRHEVLQLSGQVKLLRVPITEAHVPNVFLGAVSLFGGRAYQDSEELIVPPESRFLDVDVLTDATEYEPGTKGNLTVRVKDHAGKPVSASLSLAVFDDALAYVQEDYAIDPRRFFYGDKRPRLVQTGGSFQHGTYGMLAKDERGDVREERYGLRDGAVEQLRALGYSGGGDDEGGIAMRAQVAAPAAAAEMVADAAVAKSAGRAAGGAGSEPNVRVRSDFRASALWLPDVTTDASGTASVEVPFPDSTTRWRASVRALDRETRVGEGRTSVRTRLPLIARLQTPRFLVVGDVATLSGNIDNNLAEPLEVATALTVEGLELLGRVVDGALVTGDVPPLVVPANGQVRVDWRVAVRTPGTARVKLAALAGEHGDAIERTLPVHAHGIEAFVAHAGKLEGEALALVLDLPAARQAGTTALEVAVTPSIAVTMLDALPYLADYPYGCVEQTLSRFLPAVIVARTLRDRGLSVEDALARRFGGIEPDSAGKTHPDGKKALAKLDEMTRAGLERLHDFQHSDGGWAWWKDGDSDHFMSAYVLWGLALARDAGLDVRTDVLDRAARFLALELVEREREPDLQAWMLHALTAYAPAAADADVRRFQGEAFANLMGRRDALNAYGRALLALSAHALGRADDARTLVDNLRNGVIVDRTPDASVLGVAGGKPYVLPTAHWGRDGIRYRWAEGGVEATAFALRALVTIAPGDELVAPVMNWLVKNRRGAQWSNTRDTAIAVLALNEYLERSGELDAAVAFEVAVNGTRVATRRLARDELLAAPSTFQVDPALLRDGGNEIRITRTEGSAPLYFAAQARFFSLEEPVPPRGNELFVRRDLYRLAPRKTLLAGTVYERVPLADGDTLASGERVEVVLTIEAKNELEYLVFEDLKPAGLEAVQVRSGEPMQAQELERAEGEVRFGAANDPDEQARHRAGTGRDVRVDARVGEGYTGRTRHAHQELRDRHVAFFLDRLPQGIWELRYELRAETPGEFHALPLLGHAMYVPEIRANGAELRLEVVDP